ncbi:MAG: RidA family protein [Candidatus Dormiibacterota bacterium]
MARTRIETGGAPRPAGPYSQAIRSGGFVFLAGQGSKAPDGSLPDTFAGQVVQMFENLQAVARAAGCELADVVQVRVYLRDLGNFTVMNGIYERYFGDPPPARTTVQAALPGAGVDVEGDAILEVPSNPGQGT